LLQPPTALSTKSDLMRSSVHDLRAEYPCRPTLHDMSCVFPLRWMRLNNPITGGRHRPQTMLPNRPNGRGGSGVCPGRYLRGNG
jgi:hypothetical protein